GPFTRIAPPVPGGLARKFDLVIDYAFQVVVGYAGWTPISGKAGEQIHIPGDGSNPDVWLTIDLQGTRHGDPSPNDHPLVLAVKGDLPGPDRSVVVGGSGPGNRTGLPQGLGSLTLVGLLSNPGAAALLSVSAGPSRGAGNYSFTGLASAGPAGSQMSPSAAVSTAAVTGLGSGPRPGGRPHSLS